jgi:hypothetical protein
MEQYNFTQMADRDRRLFPFAIVHIAIFFFMLIPSLSLSSKSPVDVKAPMEQWIRRLPSCVNQETLPVTIITNLSHSKGKLIDHVAHSMGLACDNLEEHGAQVPHQLHGLIRRSTIIFVVCS